MPIWSLIAVFSTTALSGAASLAPRLVNVPLSFEPGIRNSEFVAHAGGLGVTLISTGASIGASRMRLMGARPGASAEPEELLAGYTNYLLDPDPRNWRTHVPNYRRVRYRNVYPGIDVVYYGNPRELEFDLVVAPGADPRRIRLTLDDPDLRIRLPRVYQSDGDIPARVVRHGGSITFELAAYDRSVPLVIDPVLSFATIFGGGGSDQGRAIAVDSTGATYVAGNAGSSNFPVVNGRSGSGSFLAKISAAGDALVYSTYLAFPWGGNYAVDSTGSVYFASTPYPSAFNASGLPIVGPLLGNCNDPGGSNLYVARLSPDGTSLAYSGCIGGVGYSLGPFAIDAAGNAYIAGSVSPANFPLVNPLPSSPPGQLPQRPFVLKLGPDGKLLYSTFFGSTFLGSSGSVSITAIAADAAGNIYLTGLTSSMDFPLKNPIQPASLSFYPAFVAKIKADGSDLVYSTYFGGSNSDYLTAIAADASGNTYVAGNTTSGDFPTTPNALQSRFNSVLAYKSTDAGVTWSRSDLGLPGGVSSVRVDPRNPSNIYAVSSNRLYKSSDKGATWQPTLVTSARSLWINPVDSTLYVAVVNSEPVTGSVWRSHDGGDTFAIVGTAPGGILDQMVFDPTNASVIYGHWGGTGQCQGAGIYKSTDGGDTWKATGLTGCGTGPGALAIDPAHPSTLYASTHPSLMRSDDGGDTWTSILELLYEVPEVLVDSSSTLYAVSASVVYLMPPGGAIVTKAAPAPINMLVIDPTNSSIWYAATSNNPGAGIYKTTDSGDTWQTVTNGLPNSLNISSLEIDPSATGTLYFGASPLPDGIFAKLSPDGTSLLYSTYLGGSGADSVTAIATDASGNTYLAGASDSSDFPMQGPFRTTGGGFAARFEPANALAWSSLLGGAMPTAIALGPEGEAYLTGSTSSAAFPTANSIQSDISSNFFYSADGGASWTASSPTGGSQPAGLAFAPVIGIDPKTPSRVYALADRLYVSNDRGQSWTGLGTPGYPRLWASAGPALLLDPLTPTTIYAASMCQDVANGRPNCGVSRSTDGGLTWTISSNGPSVPILGLAADPKNPSTLYASTGLGIFKSADGAATWSLTGSLGSAGAVAAVAVDPVNAAVLYASVGNSSSQGIYKSTDTGASFTAIGNGIPSGWFANSLVPVPSVPGRVYAIGSFAPTKDVYRSDDSGNTWIKIGSGLPDGPVSALAVDPGNPSVVYAAPSAGGLYRSTDAGATFSVVAGLRIPIVGSIAIDPSNSSQVYTGSQFNPADVFVMKIAP